MSRASKFLAAEIKLSYKPKIKPSDLQVIVSTQDVYQIFLANWNMDTIYIFEEFKIMCLNTANKLLGVFTVAVGGINQVVVDPRIIFLTAIGKLSTSIILAHNHPSGNLKPSKLDLELTKELKAGGKLLKISVYDHLIISPDGYFSLSDEGKM